jgi:hypothetical protein
MHYKASEERFGSETSKKSKNNRRLAEKNHIGNSKEICYSPLVTILLDGSDDSID